MSEQEKTIKRFAKDQKNSKTSAPSIKEIDLTEDAAAMAESSRPMPMPAIQQVQPERVGAGRPKLQRRVERGKAMNVYFDENTHQLLKNMKFYHDIEMKDIPYVLTREFFKKYEVNGQLNPEGIAYLQRLLAEVN
jgi:hypothetical protein